mgnify:CR=1 FL=1
MSVMMTERKRATTSADLSRPDGTPVRVLVVDDEPNLAEGLSSVLRQEGWAGRSARTGWDPAPAGPGVYREGVLAGTTVGLIMDWFADPADHRAAQSLILWVAERGVQDGLEQLVFLCPTSSVWFQKFQDFGFEATPSPYVMTDRP